MSASFSKQKSNQQATSSGEQLGINAANSFGVTGSDSLSSSLGTSGSQAVSTSAGQSQGFSTQNVFGGDILSKLFGDASAVAAGVDTSGLSNTANQLFSGGVDFLNTLKGNAGTDALTARLTDTSARDAQLGALKTGLGDLFNEQLIPGITATGVSTGTLGASRDAVARAQAAKAVSSQYAQGAASIISADQGQRDQAASQLAGFAQQGAGTGLSALGSLYGLQQQGSTAALTPYQTLSQILGGPTALTTSGTSSSEAANSSSLSTSQQIANAISSSFGQQGSQSYGFDFGTNQSQSTGNSSAMGISGGFSASSGFGH